jgi:hypothetical protein
VGHRIAHASFLALLVFLWPSRVGAELPQARLDAIFPLGGAAGSSVDLEVKGKDLDDVTRLVFDHPGFKAEHVKGSQFRVKIDARVPTGTYEIRTVGRWGVSGARLFAVSHGLEEVAEKEPNDTAATAQAVPFNCVINARCDGDGDDYFRFPARKGRRIIIDCQALRLDSELRATMVLSTADGKELARSRPYYLRTDPLLDFVAPADGDYVLGLHDSTFSGGKPYRLTISDRPQIENVFPCAVQAGTEAVELTVLGRNLPGGKPSGLGKVLDAELDAITVPFHLPREFAESSKLHFLQHPSSPSAEARGFQLVPRGLENAINPGTMILSPYPVTVGKPGHQKDSAQEVKLPTTVCARLDHSGDPDWYAFEAKAGDRLEVDLFCERLEAPGDPFVIVFDDKGQEIGQLDDHGINFGPLSMNNRDPMGVINIPRNGRYRLMVQERYRNGGPRYQYALRIGKVEPDFYPVVIHETNPDPTSALVRAGGSAAVDVVMNRHELKEPVVIEAEGLPMGVSCPPVHVGPNTQTGVRVVFTAAPDAKDWDGPIRLKATAKVGDKTLVRELTPMQRRWPIANVSTGRVCRQMYLSVRPGAPFGLNWSGESVTAPAGGSVEGKLKVRRGGEFKGAVKVAPLNPPSGFNLAPVEIPAGKDEATVKITLAANVPAGTYSLVLEGEGQVSLKRDEKTPAKMVRVADPTTALTVVVTAAPKK